MARLQFGLALAVLGLAATVAGSQPVRTDRTTLPVLPDDVELAPRRAPGLGVSGFVSTIGLTAQDGDLPLVGVTEWRHLACTIGLSDLQFASTLSYIDLLRTDEATATPWHDGLAYRLSETDLAFADEWSDLLGRRSERRATYRRDLDAFFVRVRDAVTTPEQAAILGPCVAVLERRILLASTTPAFRGLDGDPDWLFMLHRKSSFALTAAECRLADALLVDWRRRADRLAQQVHAAGERYLRVDRSPWTSITTSGALHEVDLLPQRRASRALFELQQDWIEHRRAFVALLDGIVAPPHLEWIEREIESNSSRVRNLLVHSSGEPMLHVVGEYAFDPDLAAAIRSMIERQRASSAAHIETAAHHDRRLCVLFHYWIPATPDDHDPARKAIIEAGEEHFAGWRRTLADCVRLVGASSDLSDEARAAWDEAAAAVRDEVVQTELRWIEFADGTIRRK